jgi:hypothetical protein
VQAFDLQFSAKSNLIDKLRAVYAVKGMENEFGVDYHPGQV